MSTYIERRYKKSYFYDYYFYVDVRDNYSNQIFRDNNIKVIIVGTLSNKDSEYVVIHCKTRKRNKAKFKECMDSLCNKMLIMGRNDYIQYSEEAMRRLSCKNGYTIDCTEVLNYSYIVSITADSVFHKDMVMIPSSIKDIYTEREVADKVKNAFDKCGLLYRRLSVSVRNMKTNDEITFSYINEDVKE